MTQSTNRSMLLSREPVWDKAHFFGRQQILAWVADHLNRPTPENCNLIGEPRFGTTSLLYHIATQKTGAPVGQTAVYVWVRLTDLTDFRSEAVWSFLVSALKTAVVAQTGQPLPDEADEPDGLPIDRLDELLDALFSQKLADRVIWVIDDFDLLTRTVGSRDLDWLRSLANRYREQLAFLIGSTQSLVALTNQIIERETGQMTQTVSPFANLFFTHPLGLLTREEAEALCRAVDATDDSDSLTETDIAFLLAEAGRHPDLLKLALDHLLTAKPYSEPDELHEDVMGDFRFDDHVQQLCRQLYMQLPEAEKEALTGVAKGEAEESLDLMLVNRLKRQLGLVERRNGRLTLFSDAFAYWVNRLADESPDSETETAVATDEPDSFEYLAPQRTIQFSNGDRVRLTPLENRLMQYFIAHANEVCTVEELLHNVWSPNKSRAVVEKGVNRLRTKVESDPKRPRFILSARGEGYLLRLKE